MTFNLTMPKLSPTMEEGQIIKWHKKEGEFVELGSLLLELASDKATLEFNAVEEGWLRKILVEEGQTVAINAPIALMSETKDEPLKEAPSGENKSEDKSESEEEEGKKEPSVKESKEAPKEKPAPQKTVAAAQSPPRASPFARKVAKEQGVDLAHIKGSGPHGRVISRDLPQDRDAGNRGTVLEEDITPMRKAIARRLLYAKQTIPHFYLTRSMNAQPLVECREQLKTEGENFSYNDLIARAVALTLKQHPQLNCGFDVQKEKRLRFSSIDLSIAVSLEEGLLTPIVFEADKKSLVQLRDEMRKLIEKARLGKLEEKEYLGGSFTISNLGMYGVEQFAAIINPPQGAILAVGAIQPSNSMQMTLSCDHRVIDGVAAAQFLQTLKHYVENPVVLIQSLS